MNGYFSIVSVLLFIAALYVLARANGWSVFASVGTIFAIFAVPAGLVFLGFSLGMPGPMIELLVNIASVGAMVILFGLSKALANRTREKE